MTEEEREGLKNIIELKIREIGEICMERGHRIVMAVASEHISFLYIRGAFSEGDMSNIPFILADVAMESIEEAKTQLRETIGSGLQ